MVKTEFKDPFHTVYSWILGMQAYDGISVAQMWDVLTVVHFSIRQDELKPTPSLLST